MANRRDITTIAVVALLALVVGGAGLYLGFRPPTPRENGPPVPKQPDIGPIIYDLTSIYSEPNRVQLRWREVPGATAYMVTVMSAADDSLFTSDSLHTNSWTIADPKHEKLKRQTAYHWRLAVIFRPTSVARSETATFATQ